MLPLYLFAIAGGFAALAWSASQLIDGATALARQLRVSAFTIGIIVLGFGTSLPELVVSATAAARGSGGMAIGNAFGSNIANIAMILGIAALVRPLQAEPGLLRYDLPLILLGTAGVFLALADLALSRVEGFALLAALLAIIFWSARRRQASGAAAAEPAYALPSAFAITLFGLAVLLASAWVLVWGAVGLARALGIDEMLIGLTLVAIGTSLPELAAALAALRHPESGALILGNVVGSNLFNTLGVVGLPAAIRPFSVAPTLRFDGLTMAALTLLLAALLLYGGRLRLGRAGAGALLLCYIAYLGWAAERMLASSA